MSLLYLFLVQKTGGHTSGGCICGSSELVTESLSRKSVEGGVSRKSVEGGVSRKSVEGGVSRKSVKGRKSAADVVQCKVCKQLHHVKCINYEPNEGEEFVCIKCLLDNVSCRGKSRCAVLVVHAYKLP